MSKTKIPTKVCTLLWVKAGGRCQYEGCNTPLWRDEVTKVTFNTSYIAHIIADEPGGPRGDPMLSPRLAKDINNVMLLCDQHHRMIDKEDVPGHPAERLREMKRKHEERIEILTGIQPDKASHIVLFGANVGAQSPLLNYQAVSVAMYPEWYPASDKPTLLSLVNSLEKDCSPNYWPMQLQHLQSQVDGTLRPLIRSNDVRHLSVFALAPQPLLIQLGVLLNDILPMTLYQKHREPDTWRWQDGDDIAYSIRETRRNPTIVALNFSLSATVTNDRIEKVLGQDCTIYTFTHEHPNNDFLKTRQLLGSFRVQMRRLFDKIKAEHDHDTVLHVFPAMPVAAAVEFGRIWMPKADMRMTIYDENKSLGGFVKTIDIHF